MSFEELTPLCFLQLLCTYQLYFYMCQHSRLLSKAKIQTTTESVTLQRKQQKKKENTATDDSMAQLPLLLI